MKRVTIQDIADALGVSRNTVSKAINNSDGLAEATREKILNKVIEMGYKQFSYFSAYSGRSEPGGIMKKQAPEYRGEIALLTSIFLDQSHFASTMLDKFQREVSLFGYSLNTHRITQEDLKNKTLPITFSAERAKAIVCIEVFDKSYADMVCELGIPVLFVDGPVKRYGESVMADQLYMDNITNISLFVHKMAEHGCRRFGFIGDYLHCQSFYERYCGFRVAMFAEGLDVDEKLILTDCLPEPLEASLRRLDKLPDVFICVNDFAAFDAMRALAALGKKVPEDVMLFGFDNSSESGISDPPLSTVHIHTQVMAYTAVQILMSRMEEPSLDYRTVYTQTELIERESTRREKRS